MIVPGTLAGLGVAFGCGLLIGIDRERRKGSGPTRAYAGGRGQHAAVPPAGRAFSIKQALLFALLLSTASAALAYANARLGNDALLMGAALAGFFDVHAASGSALSLLAMLLAMTTNMVSKAVAALAGGWQFAVRVNGSLLLVLAAAWLPYWWPAF